MGCAWGRGPTLLPVSPVYGNTAQPGTHTRRVSPWGFGSSVGLFYYSLAAQLPADMRVLLVSLLRTASRPACQGTSQTQHLPQCRGTCRIAERMLVHAAWDCPGATFTCLTNTHAAEPDVGVSC